MANTVVTTNTLQNHQKMDLRNRQIDKISLLNEFMFEEDSMVAKRQSLIGHGQRISVKPVSLETHCSSQIVLPLNSGPNGESELDFEHVKANQHLWKYLLPLKNRPAKFIPLGLNEIAEEKENLKESEENLNLESTGIFECQNDACNAKFQSHKEYVKHMNRGKHYIKSFLRTENQICQMKRQWFSHFGALNDTKTKDGKISPYFRTYLKVILIVYIIK